MVDAVKSVVSLGAQQYDDFCATHIDPPRDKNIPWTAPICKNKLKLLDTSQKSTGNKSEMTSLKEERSKVMQLLLAANSGREIDKSVFAHESSLNQAWGNRNQ